MSDASDPLSNILARPDIWQAGSARAANEQQHSLPTGHPALDTALHQSGWPRGALTELLSARCGIGEIQLLAPTLAHVSRGLRRIFLVAPPHIPYAPALQALDVRLSRLTILKPAGRSELLWSLEQILRSGTCGCVLGWLEQERARADYASMRRLQIAARNMQGPVFLFRNPASDPGLSPAALRLRLEHEAGGLAIRILKQRGGRAGQELLISRPPQLLAPRVLPALLPACVSTQPTHHQTSAAFPAGILPATSPRLPRPILH
jgi:cell division inhibitor SulA/protein ImuA